MKAPILLLLFSCIVLPSALGGRFVGYFPNWAGGRQGNAQFGVNDIDPKLCTHLVYAFASLDNETLTIVSADPTTDIEEKGYANFVALKKQNPTLKTMIAIGGWVDSNTEDNKYSKLVSSMENINKFVSSVMAFLGEFGFDGLDMDWEYPRSAADKKGFSELLNALQVAFAGKGYLLTAAIPASEEILNAGYDMQIVNSATAFINLMAYDMHGSWEPDTADHHAPLYSRPMDGDNNIDYVINYLLQQGFSADKINLGIPIYGRSWTLASNSNVQPPCSAAGVGLPGEFTEEEGILAYFEICSAIQKGDWIKVQDPQKKIGPYAYSTSDPVQWVGYDDVDFVQIKSNYIISKRLGGAMVWDIAMDDFNGICGDGKNPIQTTINQIVV